MKHPATYAELVRAFGRTNWVCRGVTLQQALANPLRRRALELGAAMARRPRPPRLDVKRLVAGDVDEPDLDL